MKLNIVPARTGVQWVKLGVQTFLKQPLALAGLFFMYMAAVLVLSQLPVLGPLLAGMLVPAAMLGLMAATAEAAKGRFPMPSVLLSAFRAGKQQARSMLILGMVYTGGSLLASLIGSLLVGATPPPAPAAGAQAAPQLDGRTLLILALHLPLWLVFWHAPALVHWHGVTPAKSLFFSAVACLRNFGALVIFGITWLTFVLAVGFVLSSIALLLGGPAVGGTVMLPTVLLLAAMMSTSMYFTFRDSFRDNDDDNEAPRVPEGDPT